MDILSQETRQLFSAWQEGLAKKKGDRDEDMIERQEELMHTVEQGPSVLAGYLRDQLGLGTDVSIKAPPLPRKLTPSEYRDPCFQLERDICRDWQGLVQPGLASQPLYWTVLHVAWLEEGLIGDQIDVALLSGGRDSTVEERTRNLLRRLGGLAHVRGKISVLVNCPLGRAWWRGYVGQLAAEHSSDALTSEAAHRVLHASNPAWEKLAGDSVRRVTVNNRPEIRAALIYHFRDASRESGGVDADHFQRTAQVLARHGSLISFDLVPWTTLIEMAANAAQTATTELEREARQREQEKARRRPQKGQ